jgi:GDP-4-dehydro-6-deoxy-D-mannose reductase
MRVLITGADGFVGRHLINELLSRGHQVVAGLQFINPNFNMPIKVIYFDLLEKESIKELIKEANPDGIIHLAAQSMVKLAWDNPANTISVNTIGTINLINSVLDISSQIKVINIGSSEEYGLAGKTGLPIVEESPCFPQNPYASSKLLAGQIALQIAKKNALNIIHVRPFNHFGPGQREGFVISDFAAQIAKIEAGLSAGPIKVGDLNVKRDFTDVRDVVKAYALLLENNATEGIYNICSGTPYSIGGILNLLINIAATPIEVIIDRERFRPSDVPVFVGSNKKIYQEVGWEPKFKFQDSLVDTLQWWQSAVHNKLKTG